MTIAQATATNYSELLGVHDAVQLMNEYKGVPIAFPATITAVRGDAIQVSTSKYQIVCLDTDKTTFIRSEHFPETYSAQVLQVDYASGQAALGPVVASGAAIARRQYIRVQPPDPIQVDLRIQNNPNSIQADLIDLSIGGLSLFVVYELFVPGLFRKKGNVIVDVDLPTNGGQKTQKLQLSGRIVNKKLNLMNRLYRIGVYLEPDEAARTVLRQYVAQRQTELIRELRTNHSLMATLSTREE
ncbi:MAG: PilZ domain-containing protein [Chloroflexi bacterium]|nr:MAG: PilZ domain-containing protein [Chloroflexota bacterium]MBL1194801.1 PilZ domain-containing protein [Chloroflexota bacterium]NOH12093.1 PilZ domain-containing protein [Chloroflexota bacterium]